MATVQRSVFASSGMQLLCTRHYLLPLYKLLSINVFESNLFEVLYVISDT